MKVKLRMQRIGNKNRPFYRAVATSCSRSRSGKHLEIVGTYNPILPKDSDERVKLNMERINYWVSVGAQKTKIIESLIKRFYEKKSAPDNTIQENKINS